MLKILIHLVFLIIEILVAGILLCVLLILRLYYRKMVPSKRRGKDKEKAAEQCSPDEPNDKKEMHLSDRNISQGDSLQPKTAIDIPLDDSIRRTDVTEAVPRRADNFPCAPSPATPRLTRQPGPPQSQIPYAPRSGILPPVQRPARNLVYCSLQDSSSANTYCKRVYLKEDPQGQLQVTFFDDGIIQGEPREDYCNEGTLNELFRVCFECGMGRWPDGKKFSIKCRKPAILQRDGQGIWVLEKGLLNVKPFQ